MSEAFDPSPEQKKIIEAALVGQRVIACAGSGKTATAVRRLAEVRRQMGVSRQYAALLSYSNVAVDTFRAEYAALTAAQPGLSNRVLICTVDSFVASHILAPHAAPTMQCAGRPYLVHGHEPFLNGFTFFNGTYGEKIHNLSTTFSASEGWKYFNTALRGKALPVDGSVAVAAIRKLGKTGAYTHEIGRYWALKTLVDRPRLLQILSHRYPYLLIDEAQDIGSAHGALLQILIEAGSTVSLVGDPNQAIYEFASADGSFLHDFDPGTDGLTQTLSENRRSIQPLVDVTNKLGGTSYSATRSAPSRKYGPFLLTFQDTELAKIRSTFAELLATHGYSHESAAVLCRARDTVPLIAGAGDQWGQGATEHFARAALCRDRRGDIADAFAHAVDGVIRVLAAPPATLRSAVLGGTAEIPASALRRLIWAFLRSPATGLPSASRKAKTDWLPALKLSLNGLLADIGVQCGLARSPNWTYAVTARLLADASLWSQDLASNNAPLPEVKTVHQAKGQSIDAVLYVLRPKDVKNLLDGPVDEEGRIGYVGITRARDLLLVAVPSSTKPAVLKKFKDLGFIDWS
jgi:hypothetical protein